MKKILTTLLLLFSASTFAASTDSPVGLWKTIDDVTGKPKSILRITQDTDGILSGVVTKIFPKAGQNQHEVCEACQGAKHNQPIVGMQILSGLKQDGDVWSGGKILDPKNGKTYQCKVQLIENGSALNVRGFIGFSLIGRSQKWLRVDTKK
jgi:uncharacterized protein (DUF2147 family)